MLTPQEVSERPAFPKASFGGYNMAQVMNFWICSQRTIPHCTMRTPF